MSNIWNNSNFNLISQHYRHLGLYLNSCVARCVASRPVIGWWQHAPSNATLYRWVWNQTTVVFQIHAGDNCRHCYRLHYPRRPAQYITSVKPARSEATWQLVYSTWNHLACLSSASSWMHLSLSSMSTGSGAAAALASSAPEPQTTLTTEWVVVLRPTHKHAFNGPFPGLPGWASTRKVKPIWILLKQETVSGSGISWAECKSAPRSRQKTMPAPHHSDFYRPDALPAAQPTESKHWRFYTPLDTK